MTLALTWHALSELGTRHAGPNQDVFWSSDDGRLCLVADGGTRPGQRAELASAACARLAHELYEPRIGDDLIERVIRATNSELLRRVAADEQVGTTTLAAVHVSASGRVVGAVMGDSVILRLRPGAEVMIVRPLRKFDYYINDLDKRAAADRTFEGLPWWMRVSLSSLLPWASQGIVPTLTDLAPTPGDTLLVCSDGLTDGLSVDAISDLVRIHEPTDLPKVLIQHARSAGSVDDATVALTRWPT